jgi:polyisoprenoid-binding protein YceI
MAHRFRCLLACTLACAGAAEAAGPETYALDPVHTRVVFLVEHAGFSRAMGAISGSSGTLRFDRDDWRSAQLDVTVPLTRLDLGDAKWNAAALASNLLDGKRHPEARFVSTQVEALDADHARACGDLTLHGVTGPVCMEVTLNAFKRHPLPPFRRTAGFSATATMSRKAFGIDAWPSVIGDEVKLLIEAEAVRSNAAQGEDEASKDGPAENVPTEAEPPEANESQPEREPIPVPPASSKP